MKSPLNKYRDLKKTEDDTLFGLLAPYKGYNTYIRIMVSEEDDRLSVQLADNPGKWRIIDGEKYKKYRMLKRLDLGINKLSVKYILPGHLITIMGSMLETKLQTKKVTIINKIEEAGYFILETSAQFMPIIIQILRKIVNLTPQKKYEILEKCLAESFKG
jgi:hypothetical protein